MAIDTGLPVPIFNVIKYVCVLILIDALVFRSLRTFQSLIRRYDLYYGRAVTLESDRFDRYNLWNKLSKRNIYRWVLWVVLISCAYAAEILLEFSSDANTKLVSRSEAVKLYNSTHGACGSIELLNRTTAAFVADLATKCIDLGDNNQYTFYKPVWILNGTRTPLCVRTEDNVLAVGEAPYTALEFPIGSDMYNRERIIMGSLRANSYKSHGDKSRAVITIAISNQDIEASHTYSHEGYKYRTGVFYKQIPNSTIRCGGTVHGRYGEGQIRVTMMGCVHIHSSSSGWDYIYLFGTAIVFVDTEKMKTEEWNIYVGSDTGNIVLDFLEKVIDNPTAGQVRALAILLAGAPGRDIDAVNKYAIAYKHCKVYRIALYDDYRLETYAKARADQVITASIQEWALLTIFTWPLLLWFMALCLSHIANRKGLPEDVHGEKAIGRRWVSVMDKQKDIDDMETSGDSTDDSQATSEPRKQTSRKCFPFRAKSSVYLTVRPGIDSDEIVCSGERIDVERDRLRPFKAV